jgi:hypothetical protein
MMSIERIPIRFDPWYRILSIAVLLRPRDSYLEVGSNQVKVRMGWAFETTFPRDSVISAAPLDTAPLSRGVHGFAGSWLVNGAGDRVLALDLKPAGSARVMGIPVKLRRLMVSVDEPARLAIRLMAPATS